MSRISPSSCKVRRRGPWSIYVVRIARNGLSRKSIDRVAGGAAREARRRHRRDPYAHDLPPLWTVRWMLVPGGLAEWRRDLADVVAVPCSYCDRASLVVPDEGDRTVLLELRLPMLPHFARMYGGPWRIPDSVCDRCFWSVCRGSVRVAHIKSSPMPAAPRRRAQEAA